MTKARWQELMKNETMDLTPEEIKEGWHFCHDFDGLLVGPGMEELKYCGCGPINEVG